MVFFAVDGGHEVGFVLFFHNFSTFLGRAGIYLADLFVLPEYQKRGIGSRLLSLAKENTPTLLYFGAQPGLEGFYEKNGCKKSLQSYIIENK